MKSLSERIGIWTVLNEKLYRILWITNLIAFIATWIHEISVSWLMTSLTDSPLLVSLVQTAVNFPFFLLSIPAGALADTVDRKKLIAVTRVLMLSGALGIGILTILNIATPSTILVFTLFISFGASLNAPVGQSVVPELVPEKKVSDAITLGAVGFNIARIIGPAFGGIILGIVGPGFTFLINAFLFLIILVTLRSWKYKAVPRPLPADQLIGAMKTGIKFTQNSTKVKAVLIQIAIFSFFASCLISFIPLIARSRLGLGPSGFGMLYGCFGMGGLVGASLLPQIRKLLSLNKLVVFSRIIFAGIIISISITNQFKIVAGILFLAGFIWLILISTYNVSVQSVIPEWVRGRVVSVYMLSFFGFMALGSATWGFTATVIGIPMTLQIAAVSIIIGTFITIRHKISTGEGIDFSPIRFKTWPQNYANSVIHTMEEGPVLIQVEYRINPEKAEEFMEVMSSVKSIRLRDGAYRWDLFRDVNNPQCYIETFIVASWMEHLRQHARRTVTGNEIIEKAHSFHVGSKSLIVRHFLAEPVKEKLLSNN